jgi:hypothetical protein
MTIVLVGFALLAFGLLPRVLVVRAVRRRGRRAAFLVRPFFLPVSAWFGLVLLLGAVSPVAGGLVMVALVLVAAAYLVAGFMKGAWRFPEAVRLLGNPEAWRGHRKPYWEQRDRHDRGRS